MSSTLLKKIIPGKVERVIRDIRDQYWRKYDIEKLPDGIYSDNLEFKSISFCTTCMNRLFHLKKTFEQNIADNRDYKGKVELVLIDYNSQDGLEEWAKKTLTPYIEKGIVNYYKTYGPTRFHASVAKNLAHKMGQGDIVCNVDGDNFTGKDFAFYINYLVNKYGMDLMLHFTKKPFWGTEGRLALSKENFHKLGGYDEALLPIGHEDHDLVNRAKAMGLKYHRVEIENFLRYLSNTSKEKSENCSDESTDYYYLERTNINTSNENIKQGKLKANTAGVDEVVLYKNFTDEKIIVNY